MSEDSEYKVWLCDGLYVYKFNMIFLTFHFNSMLVIYSSQTDSKMYYRTSWTKVLFLVFMRSDHL